MRIKINQTMEGRKDFNENSHSSLANGRCGRLRHYYYCYLDLIFNYFFSIQSFLPFNIVKNILRVYP